MVLTKASQAERPTLPVDVREAFAAVPDRVRDKWYALRALIRSVAASTEGVGPLTETLKWGEPAFLTEQSKSGTPVRLGWKAAMPGTVKLLVHCQTSLVSEWRALYGNTLRFEGARAILLDVDDPLPDDELTPCIAMALTYKRR